MLKHDGLWWPDSDKIAHKIIPGFARQSFPRVEKYFKGRKLALQAGGNIGLYPMLLAGQFKKVLTFEPDPENYRCLRKNCKQPNVKARMLALGNRNGTVNLIPNRRNTGAHKTTDDLGNTGVITIDSLQLETCDLIWLSVNGFNMEVLAGTERTIERFRPVMILAETSDDKPEARNWLIERGYKVREKVPLRDYVMTC